MDSLLAAPLPICRFTSLSKTPTREGQGERFESGVARGPGQGAWAPAGPVLHGETVTA